MDRGSGLQSRAQSDKFRLSTYHSAVSLLSWGEKLHPHQQSNYEPSQEKSGRHTQAKQKNGRQHCVTTRFLGIVFTNSKAQRFAKHPCLASVAGVMVSIVAFQAMDPG